MTINSSIIAGGGSKNEPFDYYPTPPDATQALLRFLNLSKNMTVWECACGEGHLHSRTGIEQVEYKGRHGEVPLHFSACQRTPHSGLPDASAWRLDSASVAPVRPGCRKTRWPDPSGLASGARSCLLLNRLQESVTFYFHRV